MTQEQLAQLYPQVLDRIMKSFIGDVMAENFQLRAQLEVAHTQQQDLEGQVSELKAEAESMKKDVNGQAENIDPPAARSRTRLAQP